MQIKKYLEKWENSLRENRFYKLIIIGLLIAIVSNGYFRRDKTVIITPPEIKKEFWISPNKASDEYTEQMSLFFVTFCSNISPGNVKYFHQIFSKYLTPENYGKIRESLSAEEEYIKKNNISQSFLPGAVSILKNGEVLITGEQRRFIGNEEVRKEKVTYRLKLVLKNWNLYIDDYGVEQEKKPDTSSNNSPTSDNGSGKNSAGNPNDRG